MKSATIRLEIYLPAEFVVLKSVFVRFFGLQWVSKILGIYQLGQFVALKSALIIFLIFR